MKNALISKIFYQKFFVIIPLILSFSAFSQTTQFNELTQKTKLSYQDRGYTLINYTCDSMQKNSPLVTPLIDFDYNTYYIIVVMLDGCVYCDFDIKYVDEKEYLLPVNYEFITDSGLKQGVYKYQNDMNKTGKYVVFLDSDLPYFANIFVFKKK